jgi:hypothetical protein
MIEDIFQAIRDERARQDAKWGIASERSLSPYTWMTILMEEVGEVARGALEDDDENYVEELVQVAAVAVAALEDHYGPLARLPKHDEWPECAGYTRADSPPPVTIVEDSSPDSVCMPPGGGSLAAIEYVQEQLHSPTRPPGKEAVGFGKLFKEAGL